MQCLLDGTLAGNAVHTGKLGADDMNPVMPATLVAGMNRVVRQRTIQQALHDLYPSQIHALSIRAQTPEEYEP